MKDELAPRKTLGPGTEIKCGKNTYIILDWLTDETSETREMFVGASESGELELLVDPEYKVGRTLMLEELLTHGNANVRNWFEAYSTGQVSLKELGTWFLINQEKNTFARQKRNEDEPPF